MGADFLLAYIPLCEITPKREQIIKGMIGQFTLDDMAGALDWNGFFPENLEEEEEIVAALKEAREIAMGYFKEYMEGDNARDVTWFVIGGVKGLFSGGMSSGDSPTDSYNYIMFLSQIDPIFDLFEKWSREDIQGEKNKRLADDLNTIDSNEETVPWRHG